MSAPTSLAERILAHLRDDEDYCAPWCLARALGVDFRAAAVALRRLERDGAVVCASSSGPRWSLPGGPQVGSSVWRLAMPGEVQP